MDELARLSEDARKLALDRFRLLQPYLEQSRPFWLVALEAGLPFRTAQRWVAQYQQFGLAALVRSKRGDRGRRGASIRIKEAIEGLALQKPPLPIAALYRQTRRLAQEIGEPPPNYWTVYRSARRASSPAFLGPGHGRRDHPHHWRQLSIAESSAHANGTNPRNQLANRIDQSRRRGCA